ncbi:MAG: TrmH family RNA methyltransferase, partial [Planctomycetota bacterium]
DAHRQEAHARRDQPAPELFLVLDRIRSLHNVGSLFRTADGFGVQKLYLGGFTPAPPRPEITKTALGAEETVPFRSVEDTRVAVLELRSLGIPVFALEQTWDSRSIYDVEFPSAVGLVLGHEVEGVSDEVLQDVDGCVEIPMFGAKHSHNVTVSAGIALGEIRRQWSSRDGEPLADSNPPGMKEDSP